MEKEKERSQPKLSSVVKGDISFDKLNKEAQTHLDTLLGNFIVFSEVPLRLVEGDEFRAFCNGLNPKYRVPYRRKLKNSILKPMLEDSQKELHEKLDQCEFVSLTIDGWSSRRLLSMLGVIVNFMSTNAKLNAELLGIKIFKGSHTERNIAEFIIAIAKEWGILNKIIRIGSDNAANMAKALRIFLKDYVDHHDDLSVDEIVNEYEQVTGIIIDEDFENFIDVDAEIDDIPNSIIETAITDISDNFQHRIVKNELIDKLRVKELLPIWGRCVCHLIQLAVQDYLSNPPESHNNITQLIHVTKKYISSCKKSSRCAEIFLENNFSLSLNNQTRWDSIYVMIESFLEAEKRGLLKLLPPMKCKPPKRSEIIILQDLLEVLEPIRLFTIEFHHSLGTSGMVLPALEMVYKQLADIDQDPNSSAKALISIVKKRFSAIYDDKFLVIANCLDPRFSVKALEHPEYLELLKKCMKVMVEMDRRIPTTPISPKISSPSRCRKSLFPKMKDSSPQMDTIEEELYSFNSLAKYVSNDIDIDPQVWWSANGKQIPILFKLSQIYLIPTPSIAENERLFSIATRICAPYRAMLSGETIELLVTLKHRMMKKKQTSL